MFDRPDLNNPHYDDCYFAYEEGLDESLYVFVDGNDVVSRIDAEAFHIGETGFGTGLNLIALVVALEKAQKTDYAISFYSVEKYPLTPSRIESLFAPFAESMSPISSSFIRVYTELYEHLVDGWNRVVFNLGNGEVSLHLYVGDVLDFMDKLDTPIDAWFLDGHSPDKNPDMWNDAVFSGIGKHTELGGTIATFSAAGIVKRGLREVGFFVKRRKGFGGKRHMSIGIKE